MNSRPDVLCNAGPLITLGKLNRMEVLSELYGEVRIPRSVYDEVARSEARRLGLQLRGTLGILAQACHEKILTLVQTELLIHEISTRRDIWISSKLCEQMMSELRRR